MLGVSSFYFGTVHATDGDNNSLMMIAKKCLAANAVRPEMAVVRASMPTTRPTIIGRPDFYVRYGEKEREAVASFDFLDDFSTASSSLNCSMDEEIDENTTSRRYKVSQV